MKNIEYNTVKDKIIFFGKKHLIEDIHHNQEIMNDINNLLPSDKLKLVRWNTYIVSCIEQPSLEIE